MSYEKKWNNYKRIVEHLQDNEFQMKMKDRRDRNSDMYTGGGNVKPFGKSNTYFENMNEAEQEVPPVPDPPILILQHMVSMQLVTVSSISRQAV